MTAFPPGLKAMLYTSSWRQRSAQRLALGSPQPGGVVAAGSPQERAVGTKGHAVDVVLVRKACQDGARGTPQHRFLIIASGEQPLAVGAEGHGQHLPGMVTQPSQKLSASRIP
jgi:hypothetical protein